MFETPVIRKVYTGASLVVSSEVGLLTLKR